MNLIKSPLISAIALFAIGAMNVAQAATLQLECTSSQAKSPLYINVDGIVVSWSYEEGNYAGYVFSFGKRIENFFSSTDMGSDLEVVDLKQASVPVSYSCEGDAQDANPVCYGTLTFECKSL